MFVKVNNRWDKLPVWSIKKYYICCEYDPSDERDGYISEEYGGSLYILPEGDGWSCTFSRSDEKEIIGYGDTLDEALVRCSIARFAPFVAKNILNEFDYFRGVPAYSDLVDKTYQVVSGYVASVYVDEPEYVKGPKWIEDMTLDYVKRDPDGVIEWLKNAIGDLYGDLEDNLNDWYVEE